MLWELLISAFALGAVSSFHCVGMCGPLAIALPLAQYNPLEKVTGILLYNGGRILTYSLLGLLFGYLGRQIYIAGFQQWFSIIAGSMVIGAFLLTIFHRKLNRLPVANQFYTKVQSLVARFLRIRSFGGFFLTGMANGLLPCGMVYLAVTGALASNSPMEGMAFMAFFGLGTTPALLILSMAGWVIGYRARNFMRRLTPYAFLIMGVLLVMRGLNLGIPYLSPYFSAGNDAVNCH